MLKPDDTEDVIRLARHAQQVPTLRVPDASRESEAAASNGLKRCCSVHDRKGGVNAVA